MGKKRDDKTNVTEEELENLSIGKGDAFVGPDTPWSQSSAEWEEEVGKFRVIDTNPPIIFDTSNGNSWALVRLKEGFGWRIIQYEVKIDKKKKKSK